MLSDEVDKTVCNHHQSIKTTNFIHRPFVFLQGFDTISTGLSWAVMYLVAYPEIEQRLFEEISEFNIFCTNLTLGYFHEHINTYLVHTFDRGSLIII